MISKTDLTPWVKKEFATTLKVLKAYPLDKGHIKPSDNSRTARDIARTFVFELYLLEAHVLGQQIDREKFKTYEPDMETLTADFERQSGQVLQALENLEDKDLKKEIQFANLTFTADQFIHMMICDQIHHRGQLTIYVRLAGGKIPSIYGPSADDPTHNL